MTFVPLEVKWGVLSGIYLPKERQVTGWEAYFIIQSALYNVKKNKSFCM